MLDPQVLEDLKARCLQAQSMGFEIARAEYYVTELGGGEGEIEGVAKNSPGHILALIAKAEGKTAAKAKKSEEKEASTKEAPAPVKEAPAKESPAKAKEKEPEHIDVAEMISATATVEAPAEVTETPKKGKKSSS